MALVILPGLNNLIDDISEEKKLPPQVVEAALREALLKGYESIDALSTLELKMIPSKKNISAILMLD